MSAPPAPFRAKGAATRGWFPACRWRSPGLPAACSHPAADGPRCRSAGGCRRARGFAPCHPGRRRGTPSRREMSAGSGAAGAAGRGGTADCGRSPGRPGTAAITGGSPGGAGGMTGVPSWTPSGGGTLGRSAGGSGTGPVARSGGTPGLRPGGGGIGRPPGPTGRAISPGLGGTVSGRRGSAGCAVEAGGVRVADSWGTGGLRAGIPGGATRGFRSGCCADHGRLLGERRLGHGRYGRLWRRSLSRNRMLPAVRRTERGDSCAPEL